MNVCVDENIPLATVQALREQGHDVRDVRGTAGEGMGNAELWSLVQAEQRLLITTDKGFALHRDEPHFGILVIRLCQPNRAKIHERVLQALQQYRTEEWPGLLVVMRDTVQSIWRSR